MTERSDQTVPQGIHYWRRALACRLRFLVDGAACYDPFLEAVEGAVTELAGDINEWLRWGRPVRWLPHHFSRAPTPASFPSRFPVLALNRIWVDTAHCICSLRAHRSYQARRASYHLPVCAQQALD